MDLQTKRLLEEARKIHEGLLSAVPVDHTETPAERRKRMDRLNADQEAWFAYYFPNYAKSPPAEFHKAATRRVLNNPEWYEVRNWSRELAKSTRTMMEVMYLTLNKKKFNVILTSNSKENADRLLLPYQVNFEKNGRIIADYGEQYNLGSWTTGEFITKGGAAFRAIGAGQSPRGSRNEAIRPDVLLIDDIDTDEDCRNTDIIDKRWNWIQEALIPTRSISNPLLVIFCGNVIAEDCCVVRAREFADKVDVVNIRDQYGKSSWPEKNSEADIDRVLKSISIASAQKEYFNNPMATGKTFPQVTWGQCPPLSSLQFAVCYADPAYSNKDKPRSGSSLQNSYKAAFIVGRQNDKYYIYTGFLDQMSNANFIDALYACRAYINNQCPAYYYIENNTLQDPFFTQVLLPLVYEHGKTNGGTLSIIGDTRKKDEKWFRIEAVLEPLNRLNRLVFNSDEKGNQNMLNLEAQFKAAKPSAKLLDGPDAIEGAVFIINQKLVTNDIGSFEFAERSRSSAKSY